MNDGSVLRGRKGFGCFVVRGKTQSLAASERGDC